MMTWAEVTAPPPAARLRQFGGLCLLVGIGVPLWRATHGAAGEGTIVLAAIAVIVGLAGIVRPALIRPLFVGWLVLAYPLGWVVSRVALAILFYGIFTPCGAILRLIGRDALHLSRGTGTSYWQQKPSADNVREYFRQS